ncbi:hypothetical protein ILYODFUR_036345 [Ilyodon furcidens]|uniref:Uncharacterized protein n=1 Tax=Ilyodon furcidens TaxID=33524 RepID=A0ABV0TPS7_9TELE
MFGCGYYAFFRESCDSFKPNVTGCTPSKTLLLSCQSTEYFPNIIGDHVFFFQMCVGTPAMGYNIKASKNFSGTFKINCINLLPAQPGTGNNSGLPVTSLLE